MYSKSLYKKTLIKDFEEIHHPNTFELLCVIAHNVARMHKHSHFRALGYLAYLASKAGQVTSSSQLSPQIYSQPWLINIQNMKGTAVKMSSAWIGPIF